MSENKVRNCLIPGRMEEWSGLKTFRVEREMCSVVLTAAGVNTRARVDVEDSNDSEDLRRRVVERRACPVELALRHVTVSDIEGICGSKVIGWTGSQDAGRQQSDGQVSWLRLLCGWGCLGFGRVHPCWARQAVRSVHGCYPNRWMFDILPSPKKLKSSEAGKQAASHRPHLNVKQITALRGEAVGCEARREAGRLP